MTPEQIVALRAFAEDCSGNYRAHFYHVLGEIERLNSERAAVFATCDELRGRESRETERVLALTSDLAAIRQTCAEVAAELREVNDNDGWHEHIADCLSAAAYVPTTPRPLSDAAAKMATEKAAEIFADPLPSSDSEKSSVFATDSENGNRSQILQPDTRSNVQPERCNATLKGNQFSGPCCRPAGHGDFHRTGQGHQWLDSYPGAKPHLPEPHPQSERCNATLRHAGLSVQCVLGAGHAEMHRETTSLAENSWTDKASSAKPHVPAAQKPAEQATTCAGCGEHKPTPWRMDGEFGGYVCGACMESRVVELRRRNMALVEFNDAVSRERDEAKAALDRGVEHALAVIKERDDERAKANEWLTQLHDAKRERDEARESRDAFASEFKKASRHSHNQGEDIKNLRAENEQLTAQIARLQTGTDIESDYIDELKLAKQIIKDLQAPQDWSRDDD